MPSRMKRPGSALQRATGAKMECAMERHSQQQIYPSCADLQRSHVMRRCGIGSCQASHIAALCSGEDQR
jgi:hypothetical protein